MKLDLEQIKLMKELFGQQHPTQPAVPVVNVQDKDSFASFTNGLRQNWTFVLALFAVGFWIVQSVFAINAINATQTKDIEANSKAIDEIRAAIDRQDQSNAEIIRRLDNVQKDIEIIKASQ